MNVKKALTFIFCLALMCSLLPLSPGAAAAETKYGVYVNGEEFTSANAKTGILLNGWAPAYAYYDPMKNKVTYDGMCDWKYRNIVMQGNGSTDFEICNTWGTEDLTDKDNFAKQESCICNNLTITGAKNITITAPKYYQAIDETLTIDCSGDVKLIGQCRQCNVVVGNLTIKNANDLYLRGYSAFCVGGSMTANCAGDILIDGTSMAVCVGDLTVTKAKSFSYNGGEVFNIKDNLSFGGNVALNCSGDVNISVKAHSNVTNSGKTFTISSANNVTIINTEAENENWDMFHGPVNITADGKVTIDNQHRDGRGVEISFRQQSGKPFVAKCYNDGYLLQEVRCEAGSGYSVKYDFSKLILDTHIEHDWSHRDGKCAVCGELCQHSPAKGGRCSICGKLLGDVNTDGKTDLKDISDLFLWWNGTKSLSQTQLQEAEVTGDTQTDIRDIAVLYSLVK